MRESDRIKAIPILNDWKRQDPTVAELVAIILDIENQPSVGHMARFKPEVFDVMYEEAAALIENPD